MLRILTMRISICGLRQAIRMSMDLPVVISAKPIICMTAQRATDNLRRFKGRVMDGSTTTGVPPGLQGLVLLVSPTLIALNWVIFCRW